MTAAKKPKNEAIALVISILFSGIAEVYLGKVKRGIAIFIGGIAVGTTTSYGFGYLLGNSLYGLPFSVGYWIWQMWDCHKVFEKLYRVTA